MGQGQRFRGTKQMICRKHHNYLVVVNDFGMNIDRILT
jgi:hypothetical protein